MLLENECYDNCHWGLVMTPDSKSTPEPDQLLSCNTLAQNPRGACIVTEQPLGEIGR